MLDIGNRAVAVGIGLSLMVISPVEFDLIHDRYS